MAVMQHNCKSDRRREGRVLMAITVYQFQRVVLLIIVIFCSVSAQLPMKRMHCLSHTALKRVMLCGHTHLRRAVSQCQTFEPSLSWRPVCFCLHVWSAAVVERGSIGEGLYHIKSLSMVFLSYCRTEGISIEAKVQGKKRRVVSKRFSFWKWD